jgi:hypothetical protein
MEKLYKKPNSLHGLSGMRAFYNSCIIEIYIVKKSPHFVYPLGFAFSFRLRSSSYDGTRRANRSGKQRIPHLLRCQGLAFRLGGTTSPLDALNLGHPRLSLN